MLDVATPSFSPSCVQTPKAYVSKKCWILSVTRSILSPICKHSTFEKVNLSIEKFLATNITHQVKSN